MAETPFIVQPEPDASDVGDPSVPRPSPRRRVIGALQTPTGYLLVAGLPAGTLIGSLALDVASYAQRPCSALPESGRWLALMTVALGLVVAPLGALAVARLERSTPVTRARRGAAVFDLGLVLALASWWAHPRSSCVAAGPWPIVLSTVALVTIAASAVMIAFAGAASARR